MSHGRRTLQPVDTRAVGDDKAMPLIRTLITDLDNTLYDWVAMWHASFKAMLDSVQARSGLPMEDLIPDARRVHQLHKTSEYTFLLQELESLRALHPEGDIPALYEDAIAAYRRARCDQMTLYPGVAETLQQIRVAGCTIVAYTESMAFYTNYRIRKLGLDEVIDFLYSNPDHDFPAYVDRAAIRSHSDEEYELRSAIHRHTPRGAVKPNVDILNKILRDVGAEPETTLYVGDSLMKDIHMANSAGVQSALAVYGGVHETDEYDLLRTVSHWTDADIQRERELLADAGTTRPTVRLEEAFSELLDHFTFEAR